MGATCPECGEQNPGGFRHCGYCGASFETAPTPAREERKVVTVLFCDLVGSTARAESLDPEDVRAFLSGFHGRVRDELQRHGGTVEKFIGDAVMALFGAPTAHEDDPERAVRAALAIRDHALGEGTDLRIGVMTGEALITLDARPADGEGMASGDIVNTAARLQSAAPVNGILVGEATQRATRHVIEYRKHDAIDAKGKSRPIPVWEVVEARSRLGVDVVHRARSALVGREAELQVLRTALERAHGERLPQLVTLVGVPGMGKSRLVYELSRIADEEETLITWRQGRCLAYGEGVAYWALGEVVKAEAGIREQDRADVVAAKLASIVGELLGDADERRWVESHLRPLLGLDSTQRQGGDKRGEAFLAWRRFLEALAEQRPLVLVLEDLHWADDGLLDFVDDLVDWLSDLPMLVVATARPELLERRPAWGGGKLNSSTFALSPLSTDQTAELLTAVLETSELPPGVAQTLLDRADGNPLYAEQFAQLYLELGSADGIVMPESIQGIVAARLDGLSQAEKAVLQDASVMGKIFWTGALRSDAPLEETLHGLARKRFLTRQRRSSVEHETEWSFAHMLLRDVAYGQIPRAERSAKHRAAADWIAGLGRPEEHAELVAHHLTLALELAEAAGLDASDLVDPVRFALRAAGDRSLVVGALAGAEARYRRALELWPAADPERADLQFKLARAMHGRDLELAAPEMLEARDALLAAGNRDRAGEAEAILASAAWHRGDREIASAHITRARDLVADSPASAAKASVLSSAARFIALAGNATDALPVAEEAYDMATALGLDELRATTLNNLSITKMALGDWSGRDDLVRGVEVARATKSIELARALHNLAVWDLNAGRVRDGLALLDEAIDFAARTQLGIERFSRGTRIGVIVSLGRWDEAHEAATAFIEECAGSPHYEEPIVRINLSVIAWSRGQIAAADDDSRIALEFARQIQDPQVLLPVLCVRSLVAGDSGAPDLADAIRTEITDALAKRDRAGAMGWRSHAPWWVCHLAGLHDAWIRGADANLDTTAHTLLSSDLSEAARRFADYGDRTNAAYAHMILAEDLANAGRHADADVHSQTALAFWREVRAVRFIERLTGTG